MSNEYRPVVMVVLSCSHDRVPEDEVEFEDISEDPQGRDVLKFKCPQCGKSHESYRLG